MPIDVLPGIAIPDSELDFVTARAGGPGGQNVNKVETKVTVRFDVAASAALDGDQKARIMSRLASRISGEGLLQVSSQKHRTQLANREAAIERLGELLRDALKEKKRRKRTRVPAAAKARRREEKTRLAMRKRERRSGFD